MEKEGAIKGRTRLVRVHTRCTLCIARTATPGRISYLWPGLSRSPLPSANAKSVPFGVDTSAGMAKQL